MKTYAFKILAAHPSESIDKIMIIHTKGDAEGIMKLANPDTIASGTGTELDPYVYTPTAELLGEIPKDANGEYQYPSNRYFRDIWKDDGAGNLIASLVDAKAYKKADLDLQTRAKCKNLVEDKVEAMAMADVTAEAAADAAIQSANSDNSAKKANVDAAVDLAAIEAEQLT